MGERIASRIDATLSPFGMIGCGGIATPAVARSRWRWSLLSSGTASSATTRTSSGSTHRGLVGRPATTSSGTTASAGIAPVRYRACRQARGDHGARSRRRIGASRCGTRAVMKATLRGRRGAAHPAGFRIRGGANCTLDSEAWGNVRVCPRCHADADGEPRRIPMGQDDLIQLDNVTKTYQAGAPPALADLSMDVAAGEVAAVMGPSGSGKSTLLNLI